MVKKVKKSSGDASATAQAGAPLAGAIKESAQQIWLAGLGAFSKAQEEGGKVFDTLVKEGLSIQRKTQSVAEEKISEATNRMATMASDISSKASGQWDKLEGIFEERVARALNKLGVPSSRDVEALIARVDELNRLVAQMGGAPARRAPAKTAAQSAAKSAAKPAAKSTAKPAAKKAAGKTTAKRSKAA